MKVGTRQQHLELDHMILILRRCVQGSSTFLRISGADVNLRSIYGETALTIAEDRENEEGADILRQADN